MDLAEEQRRRVYTLQSPPGSVRSALKNAMAAGLREAQRHPGASDGFTDATAPWAGRIQRDELDRRVALLAAGHCRCLLESANAAAADEPRPDPRGHASANNDGQRRAERSSAAGSSRARAAALSERARLSLDGLLGEAAMHLGHLYSMQPPVLVGVAPRVSPCLQHGVLDDARAARGALLEGLLPHEDEDLHPPGVAELEGLDVVEVHGAVRRQA